MPNNNIANYIVADLQRQHKVPYNYTLNRRIISEVVEGWNQKIYVVPARAVNLWHKENKKYELM